jgi:putative endonuclease
LRRVTDLRQTLGACGEEHAAQHYLRLGYDVVARRHRTRFGEIDLIVADERTLAFVEVKTRRAGSGHPWHALDDRKRAQVRRIAAAWIAEPRERPFYESIRFDAVGVTIDARGQLVSLLHLEGAF